MKLRLATYGIVVALTVQPLQCSAAEAVSGTLVLLVPSQSGLIVAADTRHTLLGVSCDNDSKIYIPKNPPATVAVVTGTANFLAVKQPFGPDPCKDIADGIPLLSIPPIVIDYLESKNATASEVNLEELAQMCIDRVARLFAGNSFLPGQYVGRPIFTVAVATYDAEKKTTVIRSFEAWLSSSSQVSAKLGLAAKYHAADKPDFCAFGQGGYLKQHVLQGAGRGFVGPEYEILSSRTFNADVDVKLASDMAVNLIEATSKTAALVPIPTGVGGPVDVVLISNAPPQKLR